MSRLCPSRTVHATQRAVVASTVGHVRIARIDCNRRAFASRDLEVITIADLPVVRATRDGHGRPAALSRPLLLRVLVVTAADTVSRRSSVEHRIMMRDEWKIKVI